MHALDPIERQALQDAATTRRGGLGQVTLFAAANNDQYFNGSNYTSQDANYQAYANSRFVIGVGACTNFGDHSYYSNRGASVLICAPSNGWFETIAGPPVLKLYSLVPVSVPASGFQSLFAFSVQRVPGGSGSRKS